MPNLIVTSVHVAITGRVQGVWYRAWTAREANARGLEGWVRNRRDGSVEAVFSGDKASVDEMLRACETGPPLARVETVTAEPCDPPEQGGFATRPTA